MLRRRLTSQNVYIRVISFIPVFLAVFLGVTILSYYVLPEGLLLNQNMARDFSISSNLFVSSLQILVFNMMSIVFVLIGSVFAKKRRENDAFLSLGYLVFLVFVVINAITLGTWSFSFAAERVPLLERITGMFRITQNAGLVEMLGQIFITCSLSEKYLVMTYNKSTTTRKLKSLSFTRGEIIILIVGFGMMFLAAIIESNSILHR